MFGAGVASDTGRRYGMGAMSEKKNCLPCKYCLRKNLNEFEIGGFYCHGLKMRIKYTVGHRCSKFMEKAENSPSQYEEGK